MQRLLAGGQLRDARPHLELAVCARRAARPLWWAELVLVAALAYPTYGVRAEMLTNFTDHPWRLVFPAVALLGLGGQSAFQRRGAWGRAFLASEAFIEEA